MRANHDAHFYDTNLGRSFPFVTNYPPTVLPDWLIVDFRAEIRANQFDPEVHRVYLAWFTRLGDRVRFGFRTDAPDLSDEELVFERALSDMKFETEYTKSIPLLETVEERCGCSTELLCNNDFTLDSDCEETLCNPDFSSPCGPQHICNSNFDVPSSGPSP